MPLQIDLNHPDVTWSVDLQHAFDHAVSRLRDRLSRYDLRADRLQATFERADDHSDGGASGPIRARLELNVAGDAQTAQVVEDTVGKALRAAFSGLFRRFDAYAWGLDHGSWQPLGGTRQDRDEGLRRYRQDLLRYALPALHRVATHDIERLENEGELLADDWLDPAEIVDAAIADRLPTIDGSQTLPEATLELVRAVRRELLARITEIHEHQASDVSFEEPMGPSLILTDAEEVEWPLDTLELNLGDVLSDPDSAEPDDIVAEQERREQLVQALFGLPDPYRPLFAQVVVDGWTEDVVASAWQVPVDEVRRVVREASTRLSALLGDVAVDQILVVYRALGERLHDERKTAERELAGTGGS